MKGLIISKAIQQKLNKKHGGITEREISQCFENCEGNHLVDTREDHKTDPQTMWFIAPTNANRQLKIVFIVDDGKVYLKTAYEPCAEEERIYRKFGIGC